MTTVAYSYIRFSHPDQHKGDSLRRQTAAAKAICERRNWILDESLNLRDLGVSAFKGLNATKALGRFIDAIDTGQVRKGSVLIVERMDRLTRLDPDEADQLVRGILKRGIRIATVDSEDILDEADLKNGFRRAMLIMRLTLGHEESQKKSERLIEVWQNKRQRIKEKKLTGVCPGWLRLSEDESKFEPIPERVAIVKRIFKETIDGVGATQLARKLNHEGIPTFNGRKRKIKGDRSWHKSYLLRMLRCRAVLGEYQPHKMVAGKRTATGDSVPRYFPAVVTETTFYRAQDVLAKRRFAQRGPVGENISNLFTGLLFDARDGATMTFAQKSGDSANPYFVSAAAQRGKQGSQYLSFPYKLFENAFLRLTTELKLKDVVPREDRLDDEIEGATGKLSDIRTRINKVKKRLATDDKFETLFDVLKDLETERNEVQLHLETLKARQSNDADDSLADAQSIIIALSKVNGKELLVLRQKLKARIRQLVQEMWILIHPNEQGRLAVVQVFFAGGGCRVLGLYYDKCLTATGGIVEQLDVPEELDLRKYRTHAKTQEKIAVLLMAQTSSAVTKGLEYAGEHDGHPVFRDGVFEVELIRMTLAGHIRPALAANPDKSPKWIAEHLGSRGIEVTPMQVSQVRYQDKNRR